MSSGPFSRDAAQFIMNSAITCDWLSETHLKITLFVKMLFHRPSMEVVRSGHGPHMGKEGQAVCSHTTVLYQQYVQTLLGDIEEMLQPKQMVLISYDHCSWKKLVTSRKKYQKLFSSGRFSDYMERDSCTI